MGHLTWDVDRLDLDAYLERVGFTGVAAPDLATLTALTRAHIAHIPFENLDILLGRGIDPDLDAVAAKLVTRHRGGYCFEHATLFAAVCERLGFGVRRLLARVGPADAPPAARTHMTLEVRTVDAGLRLADVGFGSGLLTPLPWVDGVVEQQGGWVFGLVDAGDRGWHLRRREPGGGWRTLQWILTDSAEPIDVEVGNHYVVTHPGSPFSHQTVAIRTTEHTSHVLRGRRSTVTTAEGDTQDRLLDDDELAAAWREEHGIALADDEVTALLAGIPRD